MRIVNRKARGCGHLICGAFLLCVGTGFMQGQFTCSTANVPAGSVNLAGDIFGKPASTGGQGLKYGFDLGTSASAEKNGCGSDKPFFVSFSATDGNYRVSVTIGDDSAESVTTVKAEARRLMVDQVKVAKGQSVIKTFVVNVRTPKIAGGGDVKLKPREIGALDWDDKLTLEFNGVHPSVRAISIRKVDDVTTVYLAGDSTLVDQDKEPWAAWGQMLPVFFDANVAISNQAESGESMRSFTSAGRFAKVFSTIKRGDYLFIQFAHNDQKQGSPEQTGYKEGLKRYIEQARKIGATPVLVTSMNRRAFDDDGKIKDTFAGYIQAMREVAVDTHVALIDLNAMSKMLFETLGPSGTLKAFVHYPANTFPEQTTELKDDTHFNAYGAYELARCVLEGIRADGLPLASSIVQSAGHFDPGKPDAAANWTLPMSPMFTGSKPQGN